MGFLIDVLGSKYDVIIRKFLTPPFVGSGAMALGLTIQPVREIYILDVFSLQRNKEKLNEYATDQKSLRRLCDGLIEYMKATLRHEIIHAFLFESGLQTCAFTIEGPWAENEEMIDWFANMIPKMKVIMDDGERYLDNTMKAQLDEEFNTTKTAPKSTKKKTSTLPEAE